MKDHHDTSTVDAFEQQRGRGRPRRYASNAERQAAYRARHRESVAVAVPAPVSELVRSPDSVAGVDLVAAAHQLIASLVPASCLRMTDCQRLQVFDLLNGAYKLAVAARCCEASGLLSDAAHRLMSDKA